MLKALLRALGLVPRLDTTGLPHKSREPAYRAIAGLHLPPGVMQRLKADYPQLNETQLASVEKALRDFLDICGVTASHHLVVPSRLVFAALQELSRSSDYETFCAQAYGEPLTLTPMLNAAGQRIEGARIWPTWQLACQQAGINPRETKLAPLLFDLDRSLGIADPWRYDPSEADAEEARRLERERINGGDGLNSSDGWIGSYSSSYFPAQAVLAGLFVSAVALAAHPVRGDAISDAGGSSHGGGGHESGHENGHGGGWFDGGGSFDGGGGSDGGGGGDGGGGSD